MKICPSETASEAFICSPPRELVARHSNFWLARRTNTSALCLADRAGLPPAGELRSEIEKTATAYDLSIALIEMIIIRSLVATRLTDCQVNRLLRPKTGTLR